MTFQTRSQVFFEQRVSRIEFISGHPIWPVGLGPRSVVVDLGANRGEFSKGMYDRFGCRCYAVEANTQLWRDLESQPLKALHAAMAATDGPVAFHVSDQITCSSVDGVVGGREVRTETVDGITWDTLVSQQGLDTVDLLKVDIEGAEIAMFDSIAEDRLRRITQMSVEFHDHCGVTDVRDIVRVCRRLRRLGFAQVKFSRRSYMNVLFINRSRGGMAWLELIYIKFFVRYLAGLARLPHRRLGRRRRRPVIAES